MKLNPACLQTELRVSLAAQTKQCIRLEAVVTDQAAKIDRRGDSSVG